MHMTADRTAEGVGVLGYWIRARRSLLLRLLTLLSGLPHALDQLRVLDEENAFLFWLVEGVGMQVGAALGFGLCFLDRDAVLVGVSILADAGHQPRHSRIRFAAGYLEMVARNLLCNI